ncbi:MAG: endolytic transglycosylase MltG [Oligoflexia bacterium]|nr:endolytic transglycosylase MltG [Oligoflexia bacterium]
MKKYLWVFLFAAPALAVFMAGIKVYYSLAIWKYEGETIVFEVKRGDTFGKINGRLSQKGIISSAKVFHRYAQINDTMTKFRAGNFEIKQGSTMLDVFDTLLKGQALTEKISIPEGKNLFEIAQIFEAKNVVKADEFIKLAKSQSFTEELGIPGERMEGYLYPDTYNLNENMSAEQVIRVMFSTFKNKTKEVNFSSAPLGLTKHQVIILASMVEKETGAGHERPIIAGVFINRLKKRMRLQSDPTTIYGIYENFNGNLRKKHLLEKTPYNTYKVSGLPVGPIANPGLESIRAVLSPKKHNYLYFVSQNDGTHIFSTNYRDHRKAVEEYQKNPKNRRGKSWRDLNKNSN